jgi:phage shock protein C
MDATGNCTSCNEEIGRHAVRCPKCGARQRRSGNIHRGVPGKMVAGVCAGIGAKLGIDVTVVRIAFVLGLFVFFGLTVWVYALFWLLTPAEEGGTAPAVHLIDSATRLFTNAPDGRPRPDEPGRS